MKRLAHHGLVLVLLALSSACSIHPNRTMNLDESDYQSPTLRVQHQPWGSLAIGKIQDLRPGWELGHFNYLNESYYSDELFRYPVPVTFKRQLLKEIARTGSFLPTLGTHDSKYILDATIHHFSVRTDRNLIGLLPIFPIVSTDAFVDVEVALVDQDGRRFLKRRYNSRDPERRVQMATVRGNKLLGIFSVFMADIVHDLDQSIPMFWAELGMDVQ